jgi:Pyruvate phosphate dikinase, AMP/ATP-binding domain
MAKSPETDLSDVFAEFARGRFDSGAPLSTIGGGAPGGKARGLADIRGALEAGLDTSRYPGITVDIPALAVLGTDVFDEFLKDNDLAKTTGSDLADDRLASAFQKGDLPFSVLGDLRALVNQVDSPLAIRSSSLLEDARTSPFAGVYGTKMIPNAAYDADARFRALTQAVKFVYASTFARLAKDYRAATGHAEGEEKMAVIIQELVGKRYPGRFYPELSGVARSFNYYPMDPARPQDGVVSLALGLGKTIVDGDRCWTYSPAAPRVDPPFGSVERLLKESQTQFWAVNMGEPPAFDPIRETEYLLSENLTAAERDGTLRYLVSTYSPLSGRLSMGLPFPGPRALTFAPLLILGEPPLNDLIVDVLRTCEAQVGGPVEIEFAMTFEPHRFRFLQVRAMPGALQETRIDPEEQEGERTLVAGGMALGNGALDTVTDIVYTVPETFDLKDTAAMAAELEAINRRMVQSGLPYLLIVLGRLGTTDPWLGIPIRWAGISGARVVVEATQDNVRVELSQGSHFFHNVMSLGVKYFNLSLSGLRRIDWDWLAQQPAVEETRFFRHLSLHSPLLVKVDGRSSRGVILKPGDLQP